MAAQKARAEAESRAAQAEAELAAETKSRADRAIEAALRPERERLQQLAEDLVIRQGELESESAIAVEEQKAIAFEAARRDTRVADFGRGAR